MDGIYTVNTDGSDQQQISGTAGAPSWQSVDAPAASEETTTVPAAAPGVPNTGYAPLAGNAGLFLSAAGLFCAAALVLLIAGLAARRRATHKHEA